MAKSPAAIKTSGASAASGTGASINEEEQLYLTRTPASGATSNGNGFRHHRRKEKRSDEAAPEVFDPAKAQIDYADNERGAINKLLALNAYYRAHPWPTPFNRTTHRLKLGDARDLSWIPNGSVQVKSSRLSKDRQNRGPARAVSSLVEDTSSRETAYLLRSPTNAKRLIKAINWLNRGKGRQK